MDSVKCSVTYMKSQVKAALSCSNLTASFSWLSFNSTHEHTHTHTERVRSEHSQMFSTSVFGPCRRTKAIMEEFHAITVEQYTQQGSVRLTVAV